MCSDSLDRTLLDDLSRGVEFAASTASRVLIQGVCWPSRQGAAAHGRARARAHPRGGERRHDGRPVRACTCHYVLLCGCERSQLKSFRSGCKPWWPLLKGMRTWPLSS